MCNPMKGEKKKLISNDFIPSGGTHDVAIKNLELSFYHSNAFEKPE